MNSMQQGETTVIPILLCTQTPKQCTSIVWIRINFFHINFFSYLYSQHFSQSLIQNVLPIRTLFEEDSLTTLFFAKNMRWERKKYKMEKENQKSRKCREKNETQRMKTSISSTRTIMPLAIVQVLLYDHWKIKSKKIKLMIHD